MFKKQRMEKLSDHLVIDEGSSDDSLELEDPTENVSTGEKVQGILPYLFEPEESSDEEDHQNCSDDESDICLGQNENIEGAISRLGNDLWWCQCGACIEMIREKDCLCCREVEQILSEKFEESDCITSNEDFKTLCLNKVVLQNVLKSMNDMRGDEEELTNRGYRFAGYKQFIWWVYHYLGKGQRRRLPSCALNAIRRNYPKGPDEEYANYSSGEE